MYITDDPLIIQSVGHIGFWFHLCLFASELGQIFPPMVRSEHRWSKIQRPGEQKKLTSSNKSKPVPKTCQSISALHSNAHDESTAVPLRSAPHFVATSHSLGQAVGETCRWDIALVAKGRTWTYNFSWWSKQVIVLVANGVTWSEDILRLIWFDLHWLETQVTWPKLWDPLSGETFLHRIWGNLPTQRIRISRHSIDHAMQSDAAS